MNDPLIDAMNAKAIGLCLLAVKEGDCWRLYAELPKRRQELRWPDVWPNWVTVEFLVERGFRIEAPEGGGDGGI